MKFGHLELDKETFYRIFQCISENRRMSRNGRTQTFCGAFWAYRHLCFLKIWMRHKSIRWFGTQFGVRWTTTRTQPDMESVHSYPFANVSRFNCIPWTHFIQNIQFKFFSGQLQSILYIPKRTMSHSKMDIFSQMVCYYWKSKLSLCCAWF